MQNLVEKSIFFVFVLLALTREQATKVVDELIEKGRIAREEKPKILEDLLEKAENEKKALETKIDAGLEKALQKLNIPTRKDLEEVNKKLDQILKELKKLA